MHSLRIVHLFPSFAVGRHCGCCDPEGVKWPAQVHGVLLEILEVEEGWRWARSIGGKALFGGE